MNVQEYCCILLKTASELADNRESSSSVIKNIINKRKRRRFALLASENSRRRIPKTKNFCKVIESMQDDVFYSHFRMKKSTFQVFIIKHST